MLIVTVVPFVDLLTFFFLVNVILVMVSGLVVPDFMNKRQSLCYGCFLGDRPGFFICTGR